VRLCSFEWVTREERPSDRDQDRVMQIRSDQIRWMRMVDKLEMIGNYWIATTRMITDCKRAEWVMLL
jgi:hypothetical protein